MRTADTTHTRALFPVEVLMTNVTTKAGSTTRDGRRARDRTPGRFPLYAVGFTICAAFSALAQAQPATASRDARPPINRTKTMTATETIQAPPNVEMPRAEGDTSIRPFRFHATDEKLAELRRRIRETQWPE